MHSSSLGIRAGQQVADERHEVCLASALCDRDGPLPSFGLDSHEQIGRAVAHVLVVHFFGAARVHRQRCTAVADELQALLVDADDRLCARHRPRVQLKQGVHATAVLLSQRANAPHQLAPGLEIVFLSMRRTVSRLTLAMPTSCRAARSSSTIVQRCRPAGGVEHASAVTRASSSVSYWRGLPERATSKTANSTPPCRYAARVRHTAVRPIPRTAMIWASGTPLSSEDRT